MKKKYTSNKSYYIYGKHASQAALINPKRMILEIYVTSENFNSIPSPFHNKCKIIRSNEFAKILNKDSIHQGFAILVNPLQSAILESIEFHDNSAIAILDQITDPHNLGAILRSALAFGIEAVILPNDNSTEESAIVAKTSCGALEHVPICRVTNISSTINYLKKSNFWIIGLDGEGKEVINKKLFSGKTCIVLGAEGKGIRRLTKENCDVIAQIPMSNSMESLNVSNAASIAFYEAYLAKGKYS